MTAPQQAVAGWIAAPAKAAPRHMRVVVKTPTGPQIEYQADYSHTFDAYDAALQRYPQAARIVVTCINPGGSHGPQTAA